MAVVIAGQSTVFVFLFSFFLALHFTVHCKCSHVMKGGAFEISHHCYDFLGLLPAGYMLPANFLNLDFVAACSFCFLRFVSTETQKKKLF